jgi:hypothetical protein
VGVVVVGIELVGLLVGFFVGTQVSAIEIGLVVGLTVDACRPGANTLHVTSPSGDISINTPSSLKYNVLLEILSATASVEPSAPNTPSVVYSPFPSTFS